MTTFAEALNEQIANEFGAEALGMVGLMQASDPSLDGDVQLQTIKAAGALQAEIEVM